MNSADSAWWLFSASFVGTLPLVLTCLAVLWKALRTVYTRPRPAWLMVCVASIHLVLQIGAYAGAVGIFWVIGALSFLGFRLEYLSLLPEFLTSLGLLAVWWIALKAVYGGDDSEGLPLSESLDTGVPGEWST